MITASIKIGDGVTPALKKMQKALIAYPQAAEDKFVSLTPIRTGNARSHTKLSSNKKTIEANYAYADPLDHGHSKQAPQGMTKPFEAWRKQQSKKIFGK